MEKAELGDVVLATAGRESGKLFFVVGVSGEYLFLADGKHRSAVSPKHKKRRHTVLRGSGGEVGELLRAGGTAPDRQLRRALAAFNANAKESEPKEVL
ncbi:MAG: KOW domain-containing RNA-binding protein [Oscillospiraceae bacterium]|nr:KOW domain-containing RNA-binding protein [Oscillospiraceae bacterium]